MSKPDFKPGDVAYFVGWQGQRKIVKFGIVDDVYKDGVIVNTLIARDCRMIDGIKQKDFKTPSQWKKLPKGWTYDTKLFEVTFEKQDEDVQNYSDSKPEKILEALGKGLFEYVTDYDNSTLHSEIRDGKWRIVREHNKYLPTYYSLGFSIAYKTYEEAENVVKEYEVECKRVAELSDYDYAVEEMDKTLKRFIAIYGDKYSGYIENCRKFLLKQNNFEDILIRNYGKHIEWRYDKNKRWVEIPE